MLDQDEGHAITGGQRADQLPAGVESARGGSYCDDQGNSLGSRGEPDDVFESVYSTAGPPSWPDAVGSPTSYIAFKRLLADGRRSACPWMMKKRCESTLARISIVVLQNSINRAIHRFAGDHAVSRLHLIPDVCKISNVCNM